MTNSDNIPQLPDRKDQPFRTPEGYFDGLATRVMDRATAEPAPRKSGWRVVLQPRYAGSVLAISMVLAAFLVFQPESNPAEPLPELSSEELLATLNAPSMGIAVEELLAEAISDEELTALEAELLGDFDLPPEEDLDMNTLMLEL